MKDRIDAIACEVGALVYVVGTMIELPRAALRAGDIAEQAEFFSFGTNDLTQTTFGLSRDDAGKFLPDYVAQGIMEKDPFVTLDQEGVGDLIQIATESQTWPFHSFSTYGADSVRWDWSWVKRAMPLPPRTRANHTSASLHSFFSLVGYISMPSRS